MTQIVESTQQSITRLKSNVCHRSSAIFFAQCGPCIETSLIFLNHFLLKRQIPFVNCKITVRNLEGHTLGLKEFAVTEPCVYTTKLSDVAAEFTGSAEIEFTSESNLFIPFCAVIATYETRDGLCQLHAYGRAYNEEELTADRIHQNVAEIGWTIRDDRSQQSFAALHNGPEAAVGDLRVLLTNHIGAQTTIRVPDTRLPAYGTLLIEPSKHLDVADFLQGKPGHGAIFCTVNRAFPRMACGNRRLSNGHGTIDLQATHSNFNYSVFDTPRLPPGDAGFSFIPYLPNGGKLDLIVYPHFAATNNVNAIVEGKAFAVTDRSLTHLPATSGLSIAFQADDSRGLPNRLVNGLSSAWDARRVPSECSYGIITSGYKAANKHWYWGLAGRADLVGQISGFFASELLPTDGFKNTANLALFDEQGECGSLHVSIERFCQGPLDISTILDREAKGWIFYRFEVDYTMSSFFSCIYDPAKKSGSVEHAF